MANPRHLELIRKGTAEWNKWRTDNDTIQPDLRGAHLIDANLREADLSGADLSGAYLLWANLGKANLSGAHVSQSINIQHTRKRARKHLGKYFSAVDFAQPLKKATIKSMPTRGLRRALSARR